MRCEVALKTRSHLGEGIWWDDRASVLFWVDIMRKELHRLNNGYDELLSTFADYVGFCAPCMDKRIAVGCGTELLLFDPDSRTVEKLFKVDSDEPNNRFNDGKCTPDGRIIAGTMNNALNESEDDLIASGSLFLIENGRCPKKLMSGMLVPNGIAFSPDGRTLYHTDTWTQTIFAYKYDSATGCLSDKRPVVKIPPETGAPDGMTIAADGTLFVALWGGGAVKRFDPSSGDELMKIELPVRHATCCCFGGKGLDELYITTSGIDAPEDKYPLAGSIFMVRPGVTGMNVHRFAI